MNHLDPPAIVFSHNPSWGFGTGGWSEADRTMTLS